MFCLWMMAALPISRRCLTGSLAWKFNFYLTVNDMKKIDVNVILTFCVHTDRGNQGIYDVTLNYEKEDKSALKLLNKNGFFSHNSTNMS